MSASRVVGQSLLRKEDRWLLTGRGRFIADLHALRPIGFELNRGFVSAEEIVAAIQRDAPLQP